jgi:methylenetetrahydrofolate dehydrogenase (NADP+)/methenyltetrahydrofolate cyclohydrolase
MEQNYQLIDGKKTSALILERLQQKTETLKQKAHRNPCLALVQVGSDPASEIYLRNKENACKKVGIEAQRIKHETITQKELLHIILTLNKDPFIDAILVQLPLPSHIDIEKIIETIDPLKDVDGFNPYNVGKLWTSLNPYFIPCTAAGVYALMQEYNINLNQKNVVILNRSNIVGKPLAALLSGKTPLGNATVTICHSQTQNLNFYLKNADAIITAVGQENFITAERIKPGVIIFDVSIIRNKEGKIVGDTDFKNVAPLCKAITPVPGGVGPMTVALLLQNTINAFERNINTAQ